MTKAEITSLTEEDIQRAIKLEGIFMPHARKQRDSLFEKSSNIDSVKFVHYTSAEGALNIIRTKRLWMRNTNCMSDYREVQHGFDILIKYFSDEAKRATFCAALDVCVPGAAMEAINLFDNCWNNIRFNTYISSISEHDSKEDNHGRLSMWRAFGNNTSRVAIVFNVPRFSGGATALKLMFSPVAYLTENQVHSVMDDVICNIGCRTEFLSLLDRQVVIFNVFQMLLAAVTCLKHEGFHEEREWRAIYCPKLMPSELMELSTEVIGGVPNRSASFLWTARFQMLLRTWTCLACLSG